MERERDRGKIAKGERDRGIDSGERKKETKQKKIAKGERDRGKHREERMRQMNR